MSETLDKAVNVADKALDKTDRIMDAAESAMSNIMDVATKYAPDAIEFGLVLGRFDAVKYTAMSLILLVITLSVIKWATIPAFKRMMSKEDGRDDFFDFPLVLISSAPIIFLGAVLVGRLTNIYAWVGMFHPEIWLAAKALGWA